MTAAAKKTTAVARLVEELRHLGGLKNVDLANIVGVSPPTVHRWSKGLGSPTIEKQQVIASKRSGIVDLLVCLASVGLGHVVRHEAGYIGGSGLGYELLAQ